MAIRSKRIPEDTSAYDKIATELPETFCLPYNRKFMEDIGERN